MDERTYRYHPLAFWKGLAGAALMLVLGTGGILLWTPLGLGLWAVAHATVVGVYHCWKWHTLTFTPDNRLIRRRGFLGCTQDLVSLFGRITPSQVPVLGQWLDVGSVYLGIPGPDLDIRHVSSFMSFRNRLICGARQQQASHRGSQLAGPVVQVIVVVPPVWERWSGWLHRLHSERLDPPSPGHWAAHR